MSYQRPDVWRGWWGAWFRQMHAIAVGNQTTTVTYIVGGKVIDPEREVA